MDKIRVKPNLSIFKRLPVKNQNENIQKILDLNKNSKDFPSEFLINNNIEKRIDICTDDAMGNFIKCSYNKLGDSYRSPWTNKYFPVLEHPIYPPDVFRDLEVAFNKIYSLYAKLYYGNEAVSSVFLWEQGDSLENVIELKEKEIINSMNSGVVNSINIVNVKFLKEKGTSEGIKVIYKLSTTLNFLIHVTNLNSRNLVLNDEEAKIDINYSGNITKQIEDGAYIKSFLEVNAHVEKLGRMIETVENIIRGSLDEVFLKKSKDIIESIRKCETNTNIPAEYLTSKEGVINGLQEFWINKASSSNDTNLSMRSSTSFIDTQVNASR